MPRLSVQGKQATEETFPVLPSVQEAASTACTERGSASGALLVDETPGHSSEPRQQEG